MMDRDYARRNSRSFLWHALFLALALNFTDINTIIPTMLMEAGGTAFHLGILSSIMIGGTSFMQIFFAAYLMRKNKKRKFLVTTGLKWNHFHRLKRNHSDRWAHYGVSVL